MRGKQTCVNFRSLNRIKCVLVFVLAGALVRFTVFCSMLFIDYLRALCEWSTASVLRFVTAHL